MNSPTILYFQNKETQKENRYYILPKAESDVNKNYYAFKYQL